MASMASLITTQGEIYMFKIVRISLYVPTLIWQRIGPKSHLGAENVCGILAL